MNDTPRSALILLVDDNRMDVELALDAFHRVKLSNRVQVARGGQEALDYIFGRGPFVDRAQHPLPDLILLDLKMPVIDGFEVLRQLKSTPLIRRIPVVILTSSKEEGDRALSYDTGTNSYLVKPIAFQGFVDVVRQLENYWLSLNVAPPMNNSAGDRGDTPA